MHSCVNGRPRFGHASNNKSDSQASQTTLSPSQLPLAARSLEVPWADWTECDFAMKANLLPSRPKEAVADRPFFSFSDSRMTSQPTVSTYGVMGAIEVDLRLSHVRHFTKCLSFFMA